MFFFRGTPNATHYYDYGQFKIRVRTAFCKDNFYDFNEQIMQPHNSLHNYFVDGSMADSGDF